MVFSEQELQEAAQRKGTANANGNYSGLGDASVDFGMGKSFLDEENGTVTITIDASSLTADKTLAICPGYFDSASLIKDESGTAVDAIIVDGAFATDGLISCSPRSVSDVLGFIKHNAARITKIKVTVDDAEQLDKELYYRGLSPFRSLADDRKRPSMYKSENQQNEKIATINMASAGWTLDANHILLYKIGKGRKATLEITFGAVRSLSYELQTKASEARGFYAQRALEVRK